MLINDPQLKENFSFKSYKSTTEILQIQFSKELEREFLIELDESVLRFNKSIVLRFYSYDGLWSDLSMLADMKHLKNLVIEDEYLNSIEFIPKINSLSKLVLGKTKKKFDLRTLDGLQISSLGIEGRFDGVSEYLSSNMLSELLLWNMDLPKGVLGFQQNLEILSLNGVTGSNMDELAKLSLLNEIRLSRMKDLTQIDFLKYLLKLKRIELRSLSKLEEIPSLISHFDLSEVVLESLPKLGIQSFDFHSNIKKLYIYNCKGIKKSNIVELEKLLSNTVIIYE